MRSGIDQHVPIRWATTQVAAQFGLGLHRRDHPGAGPDDLAAGLRAEKGGQPAVLAVVQVHHPADLGQPHLHARGAQQRCQIDGRTAMSVWLGPLCGYQTPVPAQDRARGDQPMQP